MLDWTKFSFEGISESDIRHFHNELDTKCYERLFEVEKDDVVVDIGAFYGAFTYSILDKNPKHCWCIEPVEYNFKILKKNLMGYPVSFIRGAISNKSELTLKWDEKEYYVPGLNFKKIVTDNCIEKIDF